jgi:D-3-phosphoglycerate dehydrogenase / 2-oxoglutarate reductase
MTCTIVNTLDLSGAPEAVATLEAAGRLVTVPPERAATLAALKDADAYLANARVVIDDEFLDAAPKLKVIGSPSTGTDHMDLAAIDRRGVVRFDIARERVLLDSFTATSELAFALLLMVNRQLKPAIVEAEKGAWPRDRFTGFQLSGKTLGVLGLGRLGTISARIGNGFGMKVIAYDIAPVSAPNVEMVDFGTLLACSDVLTVHIHLNAKTDSLIGSSAFRRMKKTAILINTARGRIVEEAALLEALRSGTIAGAGLDVIDGEWMTEKERAVHPLIEFAREHDNLVISPHVGGATIESIYGARVFMAQKVADYLHSRASGAA